MTNEATSETTDKLIVAEVAALTLQAHSRQAFYRILEMLEDTGTRYFLAVER